MSTNPTGYLDLFPDDTPSNLKPQFQRQGRNPNEAEHALIQFIAYLNHGDISVWVGNGIGTMMLNIPNRSILHTESWGLFSGERIEQDYD
ncbi:MAG TPA: hypothetical protein VF077_01545 [Nitrospiraceae bacterium]